MRLHQRGGIIFRLITLLTFVALLLALYVVRRPLLKLAGSFWVVDDAAEHADAIIVLGDDNFAGDRATRASELYRAGRAPLVVASGRMIRPYFSVAELIEHDLENRGVPASAVMRFPQTAANTREEAESLRSLTGKRGWRRVLVVTSNYHTRRASYIFHKIFPAEVPVSVIAARDAEFDPDSWWESRSGRKIFLFETLAYGVTLWELR